jgi:hypothetical protein
MPLIALAWGGFAARKTHLAKSDNQLQIKAILEKGRKNTIPKNILCQLVNLSHQGKQMPGKRSSILGSKMCFCPTKTFQAR